MPISRSLTNLIIAFVLFFQTTIPFIFENSSSQFQIFQKILFSLYFFILSSKITNKYNDALSIISFLTEFWVALNFFFDFILFRIFSTIFLVIYLYSIHLFKSTELPETKGPYQVGYRDFYLNKGEKLIPTAIFYPTTEKTIDIPWLTENEYISTLVDVSFHMKFGFILNLTIKTAFSFIGSIMLRVNINSKIIKAEKYPVIIFSHGLGGNRHAYSVFVKELASQGNIVFCTEHKEKIIIVENVKSIEEVADEIKSIRWVQLKERRDIISLCLDCIYDNKKIDKIFEEKINLDYNKLTIMGHSFGGITAIYSCFKENERIRGGAIVLDPYVFPLSDEYLEKKWKLPFVSISTETFNKAISYGHNNIKLAKLFDNNENKNQGMNLNYLTSSHLHQCDFVYFFPNAMKFLGFISKDGNPHEIIVFIQKLIEYFHKDVIYGEKDSTAVLDKINNLEYNGEKIGRKRIVQNERE